MFTCSKGTKANRLKFTHAGASCGSHRHYRDHWTHFLSGGPFYVRVYFPKENDSRGELKKAYGPFGPGEKFFVDKDLHHEVISEGPGEADCVFVDDGTPECNQERP